MQDLQMGSFPEAFGNLERIDPSILPPQHFVACPV
jgi:hypothetical protein